MPGEYQGTVYVPAAPGGITLYGTGEKPIDVKIGLSLDGGMSPADWRHDVNPRGKYMPGKPAWYMYDSCQSKRSRVGTPADVPKKINSMRPSHFSKVLRLV